MPLWVFFVILTLTSSSHCLLPSPAFRVQRHVDAIFTSNYRKLLGQMYARKVLQDIMNGQQGERNQKQRARLTRQVDSVWAEDKQMTLESILQGFPRMKPSAET